MLRFDLEAAGIAFVDSSGRRADFHALRHSFASALARGGAHPKVTMDLMRHSDVNLSMAVYTHTFLGDRKNALDVLPDLDQPSEAKAAARATGTDDRILLGHLLGQNSAIQADASRPEQTMTGVGKPGAESAKTPMNTGESRTHRGQENWQATRDSNPQPLDLESSALPN